MRSKLSERIGRAERKTGSALLDKMASSVRAEIKGVGQVIESSIPWAGRHNEGEPAGHGTNIQSHPTLFHADSDVSILADIPADHLGRHVDVE